MESQKIISLHGVDGQEIAQKLREARATFAKEWKTTPEHIEIAHFAMAGVNGALESVAILNSPTMP